MLGTKALQIFDETTCVVRAVRRWTEFYAHESCGKCTPCREGTYWLAQIYERLETGTGTEADIEKLLDISDTIFGKSFCALGDGAASPIMSSIKFFRDEYVAHLDGRLPVRPARLDADGHRRGGCLDDADRRHRHRRRQPVEMVNLTIDGVEVSVPKGTLVIRAAELIGIQIPRFCDHPLLDPVGACRQCLVEVEGQRKPMASCTIDVSPRTWWCAPSTPRSPRTRRSTGVMELLLINHPLDCPVCDKGGECPLQNQAMSNGRAETRFEDVKRTFPKPINISSEVLLDRERCVLCARCTRFSEQIAGDPFIELLERGALQQVGIAPGEPFQSYFSGNTVQICPVGALTGAAYRFRARPFDLVSSPSVCEHCASGCAQRTDHRRGKVLRRLAGDDPQVNEEWNCDKGRWAFTYTTSGDRITTPLIRDDDGKLRPGVLVGSARRGGRRPGRGARQRRRARRRPGHRRGRLRLLEVRPNGAGHQRHRLPRPAAQRRGGRVPRRARRRPADDGHLRRPGEGARGAAGRLRARRGIADRLPAAAQGGPQAAACR